MKKYSKQKQREIKAKKVAEKIVKQGGTEETKLPEEDAVHPVIDIVDDTASSNTEEGSDEPEAETPTVVNIAGRGRAVRKTAMRKAPAPENKLVPPAPENKSEQTEVDEAP